MESCINILNKDGYLEFIEVPEEVMLYISALEFKINFPKESKLHETYPGRFNEGRFAVSNIDNNKLNPKMYFDKHGVLMIDGIRAIDKP